MRNSAGKSTRLGGIDHQLWWSHLRREHPERTAAHVAAAIGAPARTVENWLSGAASPSLYWFIRLIGAYGPEMLAQSMTDPPDWLVEARRKARRAALEREREALGRRLAALD